MNSNEFTGKTIEEAIENGLSELNKTKDEVDIDIIEIPSKGFLGFIGTKLAKVRISIVDNPEEGAVTFLNDLFREMDLEVKIHTELNEDILNINLEGDNMGVVIGRRGQTLDSIQYLVSLVVNKNRKKYIRVILDTENYRQKREETLIRLANKMAKKVRKTDKKLVLEPMNPYERRVIHSTLQGNAYVQTYSEGEEPYRKVAIMPKR
ncbi:MAG: protein jag [Clostridiales bacterium]|nr:protein jag [Clostridiales bacterium]